MAVLDLWAGQMSELPEADTHIETSAALPADLQAPQVIAIQFGCFRMVAVLPMPGGYARIIIFPGRLSPPAM